jgi:hypothetical protein
MAKKNSTKQTAQAWGIALDNNGNLELVYATLGGRDQVRAVKREVYPGGDYKTVRINATLTTYTK